MSDPFRDCINELDELDYDVMELYAKCSQAWPRVTHEFKQIYLNWVDSTDLPDHIRAIFARYLVVQA